MKKRTYIIAFLFFIIDLISKQIVSHFLVLNKSIKVIDNFFYLTFTKNTGAAWSILQDKQILLLILTVIVLYIMYKNLKKEHLSNMEQLSYGMLLGGILGNFFDRLIYGSVVDFLDFYILGYNFPIFNLADCFIVIGIILIIIINMRKGKKNERNSS